MAFIPSKFKEKEVFPSGTFDKTIDLPFENFKPSSTWKIWYYFDAIFMEIIWPYHQKKKRFYSHEFHAYKLED